MNEQHHDIKNYLRFIQKARRNEWLLSSPFSRIQNLFCRNHTILPRTKYFHTILDCLNISHNHSLLIYKNELLENELLKKTYLKAVEMKRIPKKYHTYEERFTCEAKIVNFYALIREMGPNVVVETGTAAGTMSSWILAALEKNGKGKLISIDIPPSKGKLGMDLTVSREDIGFLIPSEYRGRWEYIVGDSKEILPRVLIDEEVDVFFHDSLHTRSHMLYEYNVAHCLMKPGKVILSDDVLMNKAWFHFVNSHGLTGLACISNPNLGFTVNKFDEYEIRLGVDVVKMS